MALSAGAAVLGATKSRAFNRLSYDVANKLSDITAAATADKLVMLDASADYEAKYADGDNVLELMGVTATAAMLNAAADRATRIVTTTATVLAMTLTQHGDRVLVINTNSTVANAFTLPAATGSGAYYTIINNIAQTQGTIVINTASVFGGKVAALDSTASADASVFKTSATSNTITLNLTTKGGLGYDSFNFIDIASGVYFVDGSTNGSGSLATPFSGV